MSQDKGKAKVIDLTDAEKEEEKPADAESTSDEATDSSDSESDSGSDSESSEDEPADPLEQLRRLYKAEEQQRIQKVDEEEELILARDGPLKLPPPDPKLLPQSYFEKPSSWAAAPKLLHNPEIAAAEKMAESFGIPAPPRPPPELTKSGKPLTKKEEKALHQKTAGSDWFDMPAPAEADLPRLHREIEALRLRNQLDPKRFYKKDPGEGKGLKGLPKFFQIGTVVDTPTPFGTPSAANLTRAERKRTLVEELVHDAESQRYAKKKFDELQSAHGARGRKTLQAKRALRQAKW